MLAAVLEGRFDARRGRAHQELALWNEDETHAQRIGEFLGQRGGACGARALFELGETFFDGRSLGAGFQQSQGLLVPVGRALRGGLAEHTPGLLGIIPPKIGQIGQILARRQRRGAGREAEFRLGRGLRQFVVALDEMRQAAIPIDQQQAVPAAERGMGLGVVGRFLQGGLGLAHLDGIAAEPIQSLATIADLGAEILGRLARPDLAQQGVQFLEQVQAVGHQGLVQQAVGGHDQRLDPLGVRGRVGLRLPQIPLDQQDVDHEGCVELVRDVEHQVHVARGRGQLACTEQ